jgi:hypothetical protein
MAVRMYSIDKFISNIISQSPENRIFLLTQTITVHLEYLTSLGR